MMDQSHQPARLLTLKSGGWVLIITAAVSIALIAWGVAPAFLIERPPGDGRDVETYGFDLTTLRVPPETLAPIMRHRDMVPVMHDPEVIAGSEVARINEEERGKYLVSRDRVVGVVIDGRARAYPIALLTVHEVIHDELAGVPIAVTYNWLTDSPRVYDRRLGEEVLDFGVSGLASNANGLLYETSKGENSSLWSQLTGIAVSGRASEENMRLASIPAQLVSWSQWLELYPETTVIERDPQYHKRYRKSSPDEYFRSPTLADFPVAPLPPRDGELSWKEPVIVLEYQGERQMYPLSLVREQAQQSDPRARETHVEGKPRRWRWSTPFAGDDIEFIYDADSGTAAVVTDAPIDLTHCFYFAWHATEATLLNE